MGSDRYCLRWNNHQNNLLGVFSQLLQEESLVDVTLACSEGHSIRAHKVVLSACSSYFQSLFTDHPNRHPIIILKDVCFAELQTLIEFMYRGEVNLDYCQLPTFLKTAESLQVKGLAEMTHLGSSLSPEREMLPPRGSQLPSHDQLPSSVITTTATMTAEPLSLIRRRSGSPSELDQSGMPNEALTHHPSQPFSPTTAPSMSPTRPPTASGHDSSHSRSPSSRMPLSVSPYPADTSSPGMCEDRSMSPDPDDDASIQSGPSDMTINMPSPLKNIAGPSSFPPVQNQPLSLKKESNNSDWDKNSEDRSSSGNNGSDYHLTKHSHDLALSAFGSLYRLPSIRPHHLFLPSSTSPSSTNALSLKFPTSSSPSSPPPLLETSSATSSSRSSPFFLSPFSLPVFSSAAAFFPPSGNALEAYARYLSLQDTQSSLLGLSTAAAHANFPSPSDFSHDLSQGRFYRCAICRAAFPNPWLLDQHNTLQHNGQNVRRGASGGGSAGGGGGGGGNSSDSGNSSSREEKPFQCDQCGQSYRYRSAYIKHREMNHRARLPADKLFTCNICGMQFRYLKSFNKHRSNHTLEMLQLSVTGACRRDKQSAAQTKSGGGSGAGGAGAASEAGGPMAGVDSESQVGQVTSTDEIETESPTPAANKEETMDSIGLPIPGGTSPTLMHLVRSAYPVERPRERQLFACEYCSKTVRSKENLKLHVRKHTGERPFACLFCGRAFGGKSDLTRHVRIHTGERPYHCEMCGKCFARADYLSKHLTTHLHNSHNSRSSASTE